MKFDERLYLNTIYKRGRIKNGCYLFIFIAIPIGIVVFIIKIVKNQKKMKSDIELLNKRLSELENK